jgi:adenosine deaminase/adenosine deaminase CECR1
MAEKNIAVEINVTSNDFILGVKGESHPVIIYAKYGVPIVVSTDDAGVSRNNLSNEFALLAVRYKFSYGDIKRFVYNSIEYSFLSNEEKEKNRKILDVKYQIFEADIANFVAKMNSNSKNPFK